MRDAEASLGNLKDDSLEDKLDRHTKALQLSSRLQSELTRIVLDVEKLESSLRSQKEKLKIGRAHV